MKNKLWGFPVHVLSTQSMTMDHRSGLTPVYSIIAMDNEIELEQKQLVRVDMDFI